MEKKKLLKNKIVDTLPVAIIIRLLWMGRESSIHCRWQKALLKNGNRRSGKMMWSLTREKDIM